MEEVEDEPLFCERVAGIDIGKKMIMVTIRVPGKARKGGRQQETREFGTTRKELLALADWLRCWQVERVGMESTSDYWKPAAHAHPVPAQAGPDAHRAEGALREAAGRRAPEAVVGHQRDPRGVRPGHARRDRGGRAQPKGAGSQGTGRDAQEDQGAGRGPGPLRSSPRSTPSSCR
jgi:hypothetical protein